MALVPNQSYPSTEDVNELVDDLTSLHIDSKDEKPKLVLRQYQQDCITACLEAITKDVKRIGVSLPTGAGKTVVFSNLINQFRPKDIQRTKTLILVHRKELADQAFRTVQLCCPNLEVQIDMGNKRATQGACVIIGSVQSLIRNRLDKYDSANYKLIIIDEAHHAAAKTYMDILKHFNADNASSKIAVVGFSATLERHDGKPLGVAMDKIVYEKDIVDMISEQWLCDVKFTTVKISLDAQSLVKQDGDVPPAELQRYVNTSVINDVVYRTYIEKCKEFGFKSTLLFGVDIEHVKDLHALFDSKGINAAYVTSETGNKEREELVAGFKAGKIKVMMNCGIFTEGTDMPSIDSIFLIRPTRSRTLLAQMIGRGLRQHDEKTICHVYDFVGASSVGFVTTPTLVGLLPNEIFEEMSIEEMKELKKKQQKNNDTVVDHEESERKMKIVSQTAVKKLDEMDLLSFQPSKNSDELLERAKQIDKHRMAFSDYVLNTELMKITYVSYDQFEKYLNTNPQNLSERSRITKFLNSGSNSWIHLDNFWILHMYSLNHMKITKEGKSYVLSLHTPLVKGEDYSTDILEFNSLLLAEENDIVEVSNCVEGALHAYFYDSSDEKRQWRDKPPLKKDIDFIIAQVSAYNSSNQKKLSITKLSELLNSCNCGSILDIVLCLHLAYKPTINHIHRVLNIKK